MVKIRIPIEKQPFLLMNGSTGAIFRIPRCAPDTCLTSFVSNERAKPTTVQLTNMLKNSSRNLRNLEHDSISNAATFQPG